MIIGGGLREAAEHHPRDVTSVGGNFSRDRPDGNLSREVRRKVIDAGRDCREGDRGKLIRGSKIERGALAGWQPVVLVLPAAMPHRPDSVEDVFGWQPVTGG